MSVYESGELVAVEAVDDSNVTEMQRAYAAAYVTNGAQEEKAAISAGYSKATARSIGWKLARNPAVMALIRREQTLQLVNKGATIAIETLIDVMRDKKTSGAVRVEASKTMLDRAGHISKAQVKPESSGPKALNDMTIDELDAFIAGGAKAIEKMRDETAIQGEATVVNAQDGAQPADVIVLEQGANKP